MAPSKDENLSTDEEIICEPYSVLGIEKTATADEIKTAYRKSALKHHPDKVPAHQQEEAKTKFQELAFAYAILSDPIRRQRYDVTGSTSESLSADGDFSWSDFYRSQYADIVTPDAIEKFSAQYKKSDEERDDVLAAYERFKGNMQHIYSVIMLSDMLEDEERFRAYIDEAIAKGEVMAYKAYEHETEKSREGRFKRARKLKEREEREAVAEAGKGKKGKKEIDDDSLMLMIRSRQAERSGAFLDAFAEKWGAQEKSKSKGQKGKKRVVEDKAEEEMPSEEAFQAAADRLKSAKSGDDGKGRKAKRSKR